MSETFVKIGQVFIRVYKLPNIRAMHIVTYILKLL